MSCFTLVIGWIMPDLYEFHLILWNAKGKLAFQTWQVWRTDAVKSELRKENEACRRARICCSQLLGMKHIDTINNPNGLDVLCEMLKPTHAFYCVVWLFKRVLEAFQAKYQPVWS